MGMNCMKLKVRRQLQVQLKEIRMIGNKVKFIKSQIKNPNF
jgi:hypothetical protein